MKPAVLKELISQKTAVAQVDQASDDVQAATVARSVIVHDRG